MVGHSYDRLIDDFLNFRPTLKERNHGSVLRKALTIMFEKHQGDLASFVESMREANGNGLHLYLQHLVNRLQAEGRKPKTIIFYLQLVKSFLEFYDVDCSRAFKRIQKPRKTTVRQDLIPNIAMLQKMLFASRSRRFTLFVQLLAQTGMRPNEARRLKVRHVGLDNGWINLPGSLAKNGKPRSIPIIPELREALMKYIADSKLNQDSFLFQNEDDPSKPWTKERIYERWYETIKRLGFDERDEIGYRFHPHSLRKFYKTRLEMANVNRLLTMSWMGHDTGVQSVYFMPSPKDIKPEVEKAGRALQIFSQVDEFRDSEEYEDMKARLEVLEMYVKALTGEELGKVVTFSSQKYRKLKT